MPRPWIGVLLFFVLAETVTRFVWNPLIVGENNYAAFEPSYDYGLNSGKKIFFREKDLLILDPSPNYGFYKQSMNAVKQKNEFRIFVVGASISRGSPDSNYPLFLEDLLRRESPEIQWKVVNFSVGGWGSARNLAVLKNILRYKPDLILLNIAGTNEYEDERDRRLLEITNSGFRRLLFQSRFLVLAKKIAQQTLRRQERAANDSEDEKEADRDPANLRRWEETLSRNLGQMLALAKDSGAKVIVIGRATRSPDYQAGRIAGLNAVFRKNAASSGALYFDLANALNESFPDRKEREMLFSDEAHFSREGNEFVAKELCAVIPAPERP